MASNSKSTTLYPSSGYGYTLSTNFSEQALTDDQISRNVTKIDAGGKLKANGTYWSTSNYPSSLVLYWHDNKNNEDIEVGRNEFYGMSSTSDSKSVSASFEVEHNDDGTLSGYIWVQFNKGSTTSIYAPSSGTAKTDLTALTTIPRATKIANQTGTIGQLLTINWTKAVSEFRHKLTYSFGDIEDEVLGENLADSYTWEIPDNLYQYFTESPSAKGTLKLTTYNGDTQIGSTQKAELTINANQNLAEPVIEDINLKDINSATVALTGDNTTFVLNKSNIFLTLSFNTRKFATIKSLSVNGQNINIDELGTGQQSQDGTMSYGLQYEYGVLTGNTIIFTITDTRGFTIIHTLTIADSVIINYIPLDAVVNFKRVAPTSGEVGLEFNGAYFNGSFGEVSNDLTISYKYKKTNETDYSTELTLTKDTDYKISGNTYYSGNSSSKQQIVLAPTFDYKSQYDLQLTIKDKLTTLPVINVIITKGIPIMWWNGEKVVVNGDLYIADENGDNAQNVLTAINDTIKAVEEMKKNIWQITYPIGTFYETDNVSFDPNVSWGGTWVLDTDGTTLASKSSVSGSKFNVDVGTVIGEESVTLTTSQMPTHAHNQGVYSNYGYPNPPVGNDNYINDSSIASYVTGGYVSGGTWNARTGYNMQVSNNGGGQAHNNVQPTKIINRWHRTA